MTKRLFVLFGLLVGAGTVSAAPLVDGDVETGKTRAAACAACHGPQGNMESDQFPKLAGQGAPYIYEQLKLYKSGERQNAIMAGQAAGLSDQEMKDVAAYFAAQQTRPGAADVKVAPAGAAIYHGGNAEDGVPACSGCHGPSGVGNAAAKYPRLSGQSPQYIATQLKAYRDGSRSGYSNASIMAGVAENLSDDDITALSSYVAGLRPASGDQQTANADGALMQNAGGPAVAAGAGEGTPPADAAASDEQTDQADAAAEQETGSAAGEESSSGGDATEDAASGSEDGADDAQTDGSDDSGSDAPAADNGTGDTASDAQDADQSQDAATDEAEAAPDAASGADDSADAAQTDGSGDSASEEPAAENGTGDTAADAQNTGQSQDAGTDTARVSPDAASGADDSADAAETDGSGDSDSAEPAAENGASDTASDAQNADQSEDAGTDDEARAAPESDSRKAPETGDSDPA